MKKRLFRWAAVAAAAALCLSAWGCAPAEKDIDVPGQNARILLTYLGTRHALGACRQSTCT